MSRGISSSYSGNVLCFICMAEAVFLATSGGVMGAQPCWAAILVKLCPAMGLGLLAPALTVLRFSLHDHCVAVEWGSLSPVVASGHKCSPLCAPQPY